MSGYPPSPPSSQAYKPLPPDQSAYNTPYPAQSAYPPQPPYPFPGQVMSGDNTGYPGATGYPPSGGYQTSGGGYPGQGVQTSPGYPGPAVQTSPGYPGPAAQTSPGYPGSAVQTSPAGFNPAVCPTAPDVSQMEKIPGYEQLTFDEAIVAPPAIPIWQPEVQERKQLDGLPSFTEDEVRDAAVGYVSEHCCYGSAPVKNMVLTNISMMSAFHYKLETFGEKRESAWRFEPYKGQPIDGPMNGPAPRPWDVAVTPSAYFVDSKLKVEVPHTAFVKPCHTCVGNSKVRCEHCQGNGRKNCTWCKGRGTRSEFNNDFCTSCNGSGFDRCTWCQGTGQCKCKTCDGRGQLKGFVELIISWTNHVDDYISETSSMPRELVRSVTGQIAFEEENPRVFPISHSSEQAVNNASHEYVNKHASAFPNERILKQRQVLRLIPIGEVNYMFKEKIGQFYVYGYEHKVYFQEYPQKCCCCTIL